MLNNLFELDRENPIRIKEFMAMDINVTQKLLKEAELPQTLINLFKENKRNNFDEFKNKDFLEDYDDYLYNIQKDCKNLEILNKILFLLWFGLNYGHFSPSPIENIFGFPAYTLYDITIRYKNISIEFYGECWYEDESPIFLFETQINKDNKTTRLTKNIGYKVLFGHCESEIGLNVNTKRGKIRKVYSNTKKINNIGEKGNTSKKSDGSCHVITIDYYRKKEKVLSYEYIMDLISNKIYRTYWLKDQPINKGQWENEKLKIFK
ncbi:MAG: hypothetical protein Q4G05_04275 [Clostridia bacterium]|nr:hypothetical protein [Clostridia bacterium]